MTDSTYALPAHRLSIGDAILVYWDGDRKWYPAEITVAKGDHECEVLYKDGEREWVDLEKTRFNVWKNWDGSMRERSKRGKKSNVKVEGESFGIENIREILFDTEDRIPLGGVHAGNIDWWKSWHDDVSMAAVKNDIRRLMDATLCLALQLKPSVTTTWWAKNSDCWKKRLKNAVTSREATLVVNDLRNNAISWSAARKLFSEEGTASDRNCSHYGPKGLSPVNCRRRERPLDLSGRRLDVKMRSSKPRKCSNSSGSSMFPSGGIGKVQVVARRWSNRHKEKSTFEEKSSVKNSTGVLEHLGDPASSSEVVPSILRQTESEAGSMSAHSPPNNSYCRENTDRVMFKNRGTSKGGDLRHSKIDEVFYACSSGDSTTACIYRRSGGIPCSICQSVEGRNFLVQCRNSSCFRAFHTYCLRPPLQKIEKDWLCPICDGSSLRGNLAKDKKQIAKRIHTIIGRKRVRIDDQKNVFLDEFLIKWESLSHHHDSWVPREWLHIFDPVRVHNYLKKCLPMDGSNVIDDRKPEWFKIDRIIACRRKRDSDKSCEIWNICSSSQENGEFEFLVKWMGLDYNDSTWESSCNEELLAEVGRLIQRHQRAAERIDNSNISSGSEPQNETPDELFGGTLYNYQLRGLKWILSNFKARRNVILADEMGLGKTVQVVSFIHCMKQDKLNVHPVLIVVPKSILFQWEKEFRHWAKDLNVIIYQGEKQSRRCIQTHEMYSSGKNVLFDVLVTNYELVILDKSILKKFKWSAIVIDEAHKIKRLDCKLASYLKQYISDFRLLLTGTPLQNTLLDLFSLLHFIDPERFSDPEAEAESYKNMERLTVSDIERKIAEIHDLLKPRMLRRMKSDVLSGSIPVKKWVEVPCALTDSQRELYINILEKNYEKLNNQILSGRKIVLNFILMELRKCCNHLYLFPGQEPRLSSQEAIFSSLVSASGKLQLLEKLLPRLKERGNRVLLFSQMVKMLDILGDFLMFLGMPYFRIDGNTPIAARQQQTRDFNDPESQVFVFLISTRAGGLGIDLPTADRVIIYDPDFNPFTDLQAQSRAHRIGQTRPVVVYQLITKCSVEVKILQKSKEKLAIENLVMNPSKKPSASELHSVLLHGAHTILNRRNVKATSINYDDQAIDTLLKLDPAPGENCTPDNSGYLGSIHSFVTGDDENDRPTSPKAREWENILGPVEKTAKIGNLGRGKRQKIEVNYECDESDSDKIYTPKGSSSSDSSDDSDLEAAYDEMP